LCAALLTAEGCQSAGGNEKMERSFSALAPRLFALPPAD